MRSAALLFCLLITTLLIACGAEPSANKPLPICEEGTENCPSVPKAGKKPPKSTGPTGSPETPPATPDDETPPTETKTADAGSDAKKEEEKPLGTLCKALSKCCSDLQSAGYDPSTCTGIVDLKNEQACYAQHQQYKNFGDC